MRRFTFFISIFVFLAGFASEGFNKTSLSCDEAPPQTHGYHLDTLTSEEPCQTKFELFQNLNSENHQDQSQHDDCHCPMHSTHCCSSIAIICKQQRNFVLSLGMQIQFFRESRTLKPAPFLDGPFLPPRA